MRRLFTRPVIPALLGWGAVCLALFYAIDLFIMPSMAGKFRKTAEVPKLLGLKTDKAAESLQSLGLTLALDTTPDFSELPAGRIFAQFPDAGTVVKQGRRIWVRVSKGRRAVAVPSLRGMSLRQAEISLQQSGLRLGSPHYVASDAPAGAVTGTHPGAGTTVERGHAVEVEVSSGAEQAVTQMPSLIGLSVTQARAQIEALHLRVGEISHRTDSKSLPGTVLTQNPSEGAKLKGEPVDLVVSP